MPIPGELPGRFSGPFPFSGIGGRSFSCGICAAGLVNCGGERRAVVWPVSCLVRGRARPGGRTLVLRRPGCPCPALMARPGPPGLPGEGPVPGRWVKNRPERHRAPTCLRSAAGRRGQVRAAGQREPQHQSGHQRGGGRLARDQGRHHHGQDGGDDRAQGRPQRPAVPDARGQQLRQSDGLTPVTRADVTRVTILLRVHRTR